MRYQGSAAYSYDAAQRERELSQRASAPSFEVVTGGGLDAQARAGVSPVFLARLKAALAVAAVLVVLGMARVGISVATVSLLSANSDLTAQIEETSSLNAQLKVQRSVLSSNARISRIATQNYGMVLADSHVTLDLTPADEEAGATSADGDAAQTADNAPADANVK